jgi:hypothetical protein
MGHSHPVVHSKAPPMTFVPSTVSSFVSTSVRIGQHPNDTWNCIKRFDPELTGAKASQMFTLRESVADYRYAAALIAIALRMSATNSR